MQFTESAILVLSKATELARKTGVVYGGTEHFLFAATTVSDSGFTASAVKAAGADLSLIREEARARIQIPCGRDVVSDVLGTLNGDGGWSDESLTDELRMAISLGKAEAREMGCDKVGICHILFGIIHSSSGFGKEVVDAVGLKSAPFKKAILKQ